MAEFFLPSIAIIKSNVAKQTGASIRTILETETTNCGE